MHYVELTPALLQEMVAQMVEQGVGDEESEIKAFILRFFKERGIEGLIVRDIMSMLTDFVTANVGMNIAYELYTEGVIHFGVFFGNN